MRDDAAPGPSTPASAPQAPGRLGREDARNFRNPDTRLGGGIAGGSLADAPAPDRQFVCLHPEILLAREPAIAISIGVDTCPLQDRGDSHARPLQDRDETLEEDLILVELDLAEAARTGGPRLRGGHELSPQRAWETGLDCEPGRSRAGQRRFPLGRRWLRSWLDRGRRLPRGAALRVRPGGTLRRRPTRLARRPRFPSCPPRRTHPRTS